MKVQKQLKARLDKRTRECTETKESDDPEYDLIAIDKVIDVNLNSFKVLQLQTKANDKSLLDLIASTISLLDGDGTEWLPEQDDIKVILPLYNDLFRELQQTWNLAAGVGTLSDEMRDNLDTVGEALKYIYNIQIILDPVTQLRF